MWWSQRKKTHWLTFQASGSRSSRFIVELGTVVEKRLIRIQRAKAKVDGAGRPGRTPGANASGRVLWRRAPPIGSDGLERFEIVFFFNFLRFRFQLFWRPSLCRPRCRVPLPQSFFVFDRIVFLYKIDFQLVGSYRLLPGFTASYSIWLRFTGFYLALPSFTEFSRDFTGFTLNCSVYLRFNFSFLDTYYKV